MTLGALRAHDEGIVTACSVTACGDDLTHAAAALRARPALAAGAHLTLVAARPLSPAAEVPSLVTPTGEFLPGFTAFVRRYHTGHIKLDEVERELRRQLDRLAEAGLAIGHLNSHQHLHALPGVFAVVLRLARERGIGYVRLPVDRQPRRLPTVRALLVAALAAYALRARRWVDAGAVALSDATIGITEAGRLTTARIVRLLPKVSGLSELVCHPGVEEEKLAEFPWGYGWEAETAALCDARVRAAIAEAGIALVSPPGLVVDRSDSRARSH
jgi:predicted glycoside hydrolase/deacetylase ChbG (UPF0249 family)